MTGKLPAQNKCDIKTLNTYENNLVANNCNVSTKTVNLSETVTKENVDIPKVIYVNPNYGAKKHLIHVNPKIHTNTSIHINPNLNSNSTVPESSKKEAKLSIYVNPKLNSKLSIPESSKVETKTSIYVNPNLSSKLSENSKMENKTSIYVNPKLNSKLTLPINSINNSPKLDTKTSIYVNPKLTSKLSVQVSSKVDKKTSIYVNPKIMKDIDIVKNLQEQKVTEVQKQNYSNNSADNPKSLQTLVQKSVHVNPKLLTTFTSSQSTKSLPFENKITEQVNHNVYSKSNNKQVASNKFFNTNFSVISRRKLVKVKRTSKGGTLIVSPIKGKQFSNVILKRTQVTENVLPSTSRSVQINSRLKFVKSKTKVSAYKLDRITVSKAKSKNSKFASTKISNNFKKIVSIEGIRYNSSKNQLIRRNSNSPGKKKRIIAEKDQFFIASNGKTLRRIDATRKGYIQMTSSRISSLNRTLMKKPSALLLKQNIKNNMSNKVKQRSLQFLRNKMRKNNQPCLFFQKFGYCANQSKGTCHKVHDKKQIALCRNFLQGKCLLENCKLSHDVGPEKMPTCKYFLGGCCSRDKCPYLHVKVSEKTPICRQFLQGYCAKGNKCTERHIFACPEFEKEGTCSKGKQCPYPHKSKTQKKPRNLEVNKNSSTVKASDSDDLTCNITESRKRYYDNSNDDLSDKRERILRKLKLMKVAQLNQGQSSQEVENINNESRIEEDSTSEYVTRKRPPVGVLPSYIPIN